ncbi:MAG: DNA double-strand break repair nuclease NurA [Ignisphaera sp.]
MYPKDYPITSDDIESGEENLELLTVITSIIKRAGEDIIKRYVEPLIVFRDKIRNQLDIMRVGETCEDFVSILAVDSTWSRPSIDLIIGRMAIIIAGYVVTTPMGIGPYGISSVALRRSYGDDEARFDIDVELEAKIMEFSTALKKIGRDIDMVILDGSLYFSTIPEFFSPIEVVDTARARTLTSGTKLASIASAILIKFLRKARELGIPVVGVVKRVSSRFLLPRIAKLGLTDIEDILRKTNDKFLMSYTLEPREYLVLDSYLNTLKEYLSYLYRSSPRYVAKKVEKILEKLDECSKSNEELVTELCNYMDNTSVVFYRQANDALYPQAIRLDVYPKNLLDKVLNHIVYNTSHNSVPIPLDYIDRYVRIEASIIKKMYSLLRSYIDDSKASIAFGLTNPQKYYLFDSSS